MTSVYLKAVAVQLTLKTIFPQESYKTRTIIKDN